MYRYRYRRLHLCAPPNHFLFWDPSLRPLGSKTISAGDFTGYAGVYAGGSLNVFAGGSAGENAGRMASVSAGGGSAVSCILLHRFNPNIRNPGISAGVFLSDMIVLLL